MYHLGYLRQVGQTIFEKSFRDCLSSAQLRHVGQTTVEVYCMLFGTSGPNYWGGLLYVMNLGEVDQTAGEVYCVICGIWGKYMSHDWGGVLCHLGQVGQTTCDVYCVSYGVPGTS